MVGKIYPLFGCVGVCEIAAIFIHFDLAFSALTFWKFPFADDMDSLIKAADVALYWSKEHGRNQVTAATTKEGFKE